MHLGVWFVYRGRNPGHNIQHVHIAQCQRQPSELVAHVFESLVLLICAALTLPGCLNPVIVTDSLLQSYQAFLECLGSDGIEFVHDLSQTSLVWCEPSFPFVDCAEIPELNCEEILVHFVKVLRFDQEVVVRHSWHCAVKLKKKKKKKTARSPYVQSSSTWNGQPCFKNFFVFFFKKKKTRGDVRFISGHRRRLKTDKTTRRPAPSVPLHQPSKVVGHSMSARTARRVLRDPHQHEIFPPLGSPAVHQL